MCSERREKKDLKELSLLFSGKYSVINKKKKRSLKNALVQHTGQGNHHYRAAATLGSACRNKGIRNFLVGG